MKRLFSLTILLLSFLALTQARSETGIFVSGNISGENKTASPTVCTDSAGRDLASLGAFLGGTVVNVNDGSTGRITAVSGSTFTAPLTGGKANAWRVGDSFTILAGEYGVVTGVTVNGVRVPFSTELGGVIDFRAPQRKSE